MEPALADSGQPGETSKRCARRSLNIGDSRFDLLMVEVQEALAPLLHVSWLVLSVVSRIRLAFGARR
jgi:hypothetical protein